MLKYYYSCVFASKLRGKRFFFFSCLAEFLVFLAKEIALCQSDLQRNCSVEIRNCLVEQLG